MSPKSSSLSIAEGSEASASLVLVGGLKRVGLRVGMKRVEGAREDSSPFPSAHLCHSCHSSLSFLLLSFSNAK
eukprot:209923-Pyramimonas_sp.AAC.2